MEVIMGGYGPRDSLREPYMGYPAYGAVHEVLPNPELNKFIYNFRQIADSVFDVEQNAVVIEGLDSLETDSADYDSRDFYKAFDIESLSVSVVEMDPSKKTAKKIHKLWERQDYGAVSQEARTEIDKTVGTGGRGLGMKLDRVDGVGGKLPNIGAGEIRKKLALMPDTTQHEETFKIIDDEAYLVLDAINRRLNQQVVYPWDITPHVTFAVFRPHAGPSQVQTIMQETNRYLEENPVTIKLRELKFRHKGVRNGSLD